MSVHRLVLPLHTALNLPAEIGRDERVRLHTILATNAFAKAGPPIVAAYMQRYGKAAIEHGRVMGADAVATVMWGLRGTAPVSSAIFFAVSPVQTLQGPEAFEWLATYYGRTGEAGLTWDARLRAFLTDLFSQAITAASRSRQDSTLAIRRLGADAAESPFAA